MNRKSTFLAGLFLLCMGVLLLQIVETRVLSVISYYHLAFFAISMAMFGMTAGALIAYFNQARLAPEHLLGHLAWIAGAFALAVVLSTVVLISTVLLDTSVGIFLSALLFAALLYGTSSRSIDQTVLKPELAGNLTLMIQALVLLFVGADVLIMYVWQARRRVLPRRLKPAPPAVEAG